MNSWLYLADCLLSSLHEVQSVIRFLNVKKFLVAKSSQRDCDMAGISRGRLHFEKEG